MNRIGLLALICLCLAAMVPCACSVTGDSFALTASAADNPLGSLTVSGQCSLPDGAVVLVRAQGAPEKGSQLEQAVLAEVRQGRYLADLGLHETLNYRIVVSLSPQWNPNGLLPPEPPRFSDPDLKVTERNGSWEIERLFAFRLGTPEQENDLLGMHLTKLKEAFSALNLAEKNLRELEKTHNAKQLARWLRLHLDRIRPTLLGGEGIDPIFPTAHEDIKKYESYLLRRYHAILADITGASGESEKLSRNWTLVERYRKKSEEKQAILSQKLGD